MIAGLRSFTQVYTGSHSGLLRFTQVYTGLPRYTQVYRGANIKLVPLVMIGRLAVSPHHYLLLSQEKEKLIP